MRESKIKSILEDNTLVKAMQEINHLHEIEVLRALTEVGIALHDERYSGALSTMRRNSLIAIETHLCSRVNLEILANGEKTEVNSYISPLNCDLYRQICLPPRWHVVLSVSDEHKFFVNEVTQTVLQYYSGRVTFMSYDSSLSFYGRIAEFKLTRDGIYKAQYDKR